MQRCNHAWAQPLAVGGGYVGCRGLRARSPLPGRLRCIQVGSLLSRVNYDRSGVERLQAGVDEARHDSHRGARHAPQASQQ